VTSTAVNWFSPASFASIKIKVQLNFSPDLYIRAQILRQQLGIQVIKMYLLRLYCQNVVENVVIALKLYTTMSAMIVLMFIDFCVKHLIKFD
jgi:hypothetical protein